MTKEQEISIINKINKLLSDEQYVQPIIDRTQTHAIYGILSKEKLESIRKLMKEIGATKLRNVKTQFNSFVLCFNASKIN